METEDIKKVLQHKLQLNKDRYEEAKEQGLYKLEHIYFVTIGVLEDVIRLFPQETIEQKRRVEPSHTPGE